MLFAFDEISKKTVDSAIDFNFWVVTFPALLGALIIGMGGVVLTAITVYGKIATKIRELKDDLRLNTAATLAVMPAVAEKVDSAAKESAAAIVETKRDTRETAAKLAFHTEETAAKVIESVDSLKTQIKGEDGTCVTARLKKLEEQHADLAREVKSSHTDMKQAIDTLTHEVRVMTGT